MMKEKEHFWVLLEGLRDKKGATSSFSFQSLIFKAKKFAEL